MVMLDTNIILRYLMNDNPEMADKAEQYLNAGNVSVTIEVIAEVIYVLKGVYLMERDKIANTNCVLYGYHTVRDVEIATFDKKLSKLIAAI